MKKIGLVGGTGPESTLMYYKELNSRIDELTNKEAMPEIMIESVDFRRAWKMVCDEVLLRKIKKVGLLGTIFTMEKEYMKKDLIAAGVDVVVPNEKERNLVAERILNELELGIVKESTLKEFNTIISRMKDEEGIEAVILGCTELPLLLNSDNCVLPCLDAVEIHINKLISLSI